MGTGTFLERLIWLLSGRPIPVAAVPDSREDGTSGDNGSRPAKDRPSRWAALDDLRLDG